MEMRSRSLRSVLFEWHALGRIRLVYSVVVLGCRVRFSYSPYSVVGGCERRGRNTAVVYQHSARQFNGYADQLQSKLEIKAFSESKQFYLGV